VGGPPLVVDGEKLVLRCTTRLLSDFESGWSPMSKLEKVEVESEVARVIVRLATRGVPSTPNIELKKATWSGMPFGVRRVTLRKLGALRSAKESAK